MSETKTVTCQRCLGTGFVKGDDTLISRCPNCGGKGNFVSGRVPEPQPGNHHDHGKSDPDRKCSWPECNCRISWPDGYQPTDHECPRTYGSPAFEPTSREPQPAQQFRAPIRTSEIFDAGMKAQAEIARLSLVAHEQRHRAQEAEAQVKALENHQDEAATLRAKVEEQLAKIGILEDQRSGLYARLGAQTEQVIRLKAEIEQVRAEREVRDEEIVRLQRKLAQQPTSMQIDQLTAEINKLNATVEAKIEVIQVQRDRINELTQSRPDPIPGFPSFQDEPEPEPIQRSLDAVMEQAQDQRWRGIGKVVEEAGEVLQICGKLIAYPGGLHPDGQGPLKGRITDEIADLRAALVYFTEKNSLDHLAMGHRLSAKLYKFRQWVLSGLK